jgi:PAS domain S-box-containing protein
MKTLPTIRGDDSELQALASHAEQRPIMAELFREARARLQERPRMSKTSVAVANGESQRLLHELEVHQVELEMQNVELQDARDAMEILLEKSTDLYDFAPVGYFSLDEAGVIVEANLTSATMLGVERSRLLKQSLLVFVPPPDRPVFLAFLKKVFAGPRDQACEMQLLKADGATLGASFRAISAAGRNRERKWCRVAFVDMSERLAAEAALRESEKRYRTLFELVPMGVYTCDASGVIQNFNARAAEFWGRTPVAGDPSERFCGSFKLFRPDGSLMPKDQCPMAEVLSGKLPGVVDMEVVFEQPGGARLAMVVNIRSLKQEQGKIIGAINCFYDTTERKQAEAAQRRVAVLAASNLKLEQEIVRRQAVEQSLRESEVHQIQLLAQSRLLQEQLRNLSRQVIQAQEAERREISRELHDVIAQTLTGISLRLASMQSQAGLDAKVFARTITHTRRLVEKSVDIVHQFARELRPAVLDDLGVIPALHAFLKNFSARTGIRSHLKAYAGVEQMDMARRTVLFRVAQEALTNVGRHARASQVEINIRKLPASMAMEIRDNGKSFSVERTLQANSGKHLGLLGMRERVEMVGGTFAVKSSPGQGTKVQVEIPFGPARKPRRKKPAKTI